MRKKRSYQVCFFSTSFCLVAASSSFFNNRRKKKDTDEQAGGRARYVMRLIRRPHKYDCDKKARLRQTKSP